MGKKLVQKTIEGIPMILNLSDGGISRRLWGRGRREPCFMWILREEATGVFGLDIGANIGYTTLSMVKHMKLVHAYEPDSRSRWILGMNQKLNGLLKKMIIFPHAVSDKDGVIDVYLSKKPNLTSVKKTAKTVGTETVKTVKLDTEYIDNIPNFIKMDIEGHELEVLRGGMNCFKKAKNCKILMELHPMYFDGKAFEMVLRDMAKWGFKCKYVVNAKDKQWDFDNRGYKPFKTIKGFPRMIYKDPKWEDVVRWACYLDPKDNHKFIRAMLLVKG